MPGGVWHRDELPRVERGGSRRLPESGVPHRRGNGMATFTSYEEHDAVGLAALVARGEITAEELLEAAIERVEARNGRKL